MDKGLNTIAFSTGPQEATLTIEGAADLAQRGRQLVYTDFHPQTQKITYLWEEDGVSKKDEHVARQPAETYQIHCAGKPVMKSILLELAP